MLTIPFRKGLLVLLVLQLLAFSLFANTFSAEWSHDDFPVIVDNLDIRSLAEFAKDSYPGRPLRELTYLIDFQVFNLEPAGYHIQNIFWHGLNAFLLFTLSLRLGLSRREAWLAALLFLAHPLQVEVVANISHRKDSLALSFCLVAFLVWLRGRRDDRFDYPWLALSILFGGVAMLAKQNAVVLPAVVLWYELLFRGVWGRLWKGSRLLPVTLALAGVGAGWLFFFRFIAGKNWGGAMALMLATKTGLRDGFSPTVYYATVAKSWLFNWGHLLWPRDLAIEYHLPPATGFGDAQVVAAMAVVALLLLGIALLWRRLPVAVFGLGWFLLFWLPTSNLLPQVYFAADRYMYAPSAGALLAVAVLLDRLVTGLWSYRMAAMLLVTVLAVLCWQQNRVWLSVESLWTQAVKVSPNSSFALNNLGNVYLLRGELLPAKELYERSATVDPVNPTAFYNLGLIYERAGMQSLAVEYYRKFLRFKSPEYAPQAAALRQRLGE